ncbi:hypothetical protein [Helicobacter rodentium]|nr:hypothetical protein [Helicobacter rodentium]
MESSKERLDYGFASVGKLLRSVRFGQVLAMTKWQTLWLLVIARNT